MPRFLEELVLCRASRKLESHECYDSMMRSSNGLFELKSSSQVGGGARAGKKVTGPTVNHNIGAIAGNLCI